MYANTDSLNQPEPADIKIDPVPGVLTNMSEDDHATLLEYLMTRIRQGNTFRDQKLARYARIDQLISTWQKLSPEDSKREQDEDNTGRQQAIAMNLPVLASHLEDTQAFFAEIFAPNGADFYVVPAENESDSSKALAQKMNRDTRGRKYYKEMCATLRALIKYNIGGFQPRWESGGGEGHLAEPGNRVESIDVWNHIYDISVVDVSKIPTEAEYSARITVKNRMWIQKRSKSGVLQRIDKVLKNEDNKNFEEGKVYGSAKFYRFPPSHIGLTKDGQDTQTTSATSVNWESYGAGLATEKSISIPGYEVIEMYCWVNPTQLKLNNDRINDYRLWKFTIIGGCEVCAAEEVIGVGDKAPEIPHYMGYMTQDDMKEAQRSVMELMKSFQRFSSFLVNIMVAGARQNIWGTEVYDPTMLDIDRTKPGDVARRIPSKQAGRDVRTGLMRLDSNPGTDHAMQMLEATLTLMQRFFPSQALPQQVAGIDRAVKNQVAAVMQGAQRRLHMTVRLVDSDIMSPLRLQMYRNLAANDKEGLEGLTEEAVASVLGSGLKQLDAEATASEIKEVIYAVLQNPESASIFDMIKLMRYWSRLMNSPSDLGDFVKAQPQAQTNPNGGAGAAPDVLGASGLGAATPPVVTAV